MLEASALPALRGYRILRELGQGATATVYAAVHERTRVAVALKIFHPGLSSTREFRRRITGEVEGMRGLDHPNVVKVIEDLTHEDPPAIVMELIEGESLATFQRRLPYVLPEVSAWIALEILAALEASHARGIIHRDVKPSNILVARDGRVLVTDFGLAKIHEESGGTLTGTVLGSPDYMSPEQAQGGSVTAASDLFSVTSVLYFLVTGTRPFARASTLATLAAVNAAEHEPAFRRNPKVSWGLARILERGFARRPEDRFASAAEYRAALGAYLADVGIGVADGVLDVKANGVDDDSFAFRRWLDDPEEVTMEALRAMATRLAADCARRIDERDAAGAREALTHLAIVAPESPGIGEYSERISRLEGRQARGGRRRIWIGLAVGSAAALSALAGVLTIGPGGAKRGSSNDARGAGIPLVTAPTNTGAPQGATSQSPDGVVAPARMAALTPPKSPSSPEVAQTPAVLPATEPETVAGPELPSATMASPAADAAADAAAAAAAVAGGDTDADTDADSTPYTTVPPKEPSRRPRRPSAPGTERVNAAASPTAHRHFPSPMRKEAIRFDLPADVRAVWDGTPVDRVRGVAAMPGLHSLTLIKPGFAPLTRDIEVKSGEPTVIRVGRPR